MEEQETEEKMLRIEKLIEYNDNLIKEIRNRQIEMINKIIELTELINKL